MREIESAINAKTFTLAYEPELPNTLNRNPNTSESWMSWREEPSPRGWQRMFGNRDSQRMFGSPLLQPRLTVGASDDVYEKEADDFAKTIAFPQSPLGRFSKVDGTKDEEHRDTLQSKRTTARSLLQSMPVRTMQQALGNRQFAQLVREAFPAHDSPGLQRKCACGGELEGKSAECRTQHSGVQGFSRADAGPGPSPRIEGVLVVPGRPWARSVSLTLEPAFGQDFSQARIHDVSKAADSAAPVGTLVFPVVNHIMFGSGQYAPATADGNGPLATS